MMGVWREKSKKRSVTPNVLPLPKRKALMKKFESNLATSESKKETLSAKYVQCRQALKWGMLAAFPLPEDDAERKVGI